MVFVECTPLVFEPLDKFLISVTVGCPSFDLSGQPLVWCHEQDVGRIDKGE